MDEMESKVDPLPSKVDPLPNKADPLPSNEDSADFSVGDRVTTYFTIRNESHKLISGKIFDYNSQTNTYGVEYEDGEVHHNVERRFLLTDPEADELHEKLKAQNRKDGTCRIM